MYAFQLWREYKLSLSEIYAVFPNIRVEYADQRVCILDTKDKELVLRWVHHMWGTIKLIELFEDYRWKVHESIYYTLWGFDGKYRFWLSMLSENARDQPLKTLLMTCKKYFKENKVSARFVNKDFKNLTSAQIIGENLVERGSDFTLVITNNKTQYFWKSIWVQDIEAYSRRDYGKTRDMEVGMLPPKLAQIMIHLAWWKAIYDPFCGLGTVLIESILMENTQVYWSDISENNIAKTQDNIEFARSNFSNDLKISEVSVLDARAIWSSKFLSYADAIVTEGFLGQIFQKYSVTEKKITEEKVKLLDIYTHFFKWLKQAKFSWNIVISFPFWEVKWKYFYFTEIYAILEKYTNILSLLPKNSDIRTTKSGSLLYKREGQVVGREIFKLNIK